MNIIKIFVFLLVTFTVTAQPVNTPDVSMVRDSYTFSWAYDLKVELNGQKLDMTYHIEPDSGYYARSMKMLPGAIEVADIDRKLKFMTIGSLARLETYEEKNKKFLKSRYRYTKLPEKTIMGYRCIGLKAETDGEEATIYFTNDAPAAYPELYKELRIHHLVISLAEYGFSEKSLLMVSDIKLKQKDGSATITCTRFEKQPLVVWKSDYTWPPK